MRYIILLLLNLPVIFLAFFNIITQYKLKKTTLERFKFQFSFWLIILIVLVSSFPVYNLLSGKPILDSSELSLFDIVQTTAIVIVLYIVNRQRQKIDQNEKRLRELHQALSIELSKKTEAKP